MRLSEANKTVEKINSENKLKHILNMPLFLGILIGLIMGASCVFFKPVRSYYKVHNVWESGLKDLEQTRFLDRQLSIGLHEAARQASPSAGWVNWYKGNWSVDEPSALSLSLDSLAHEYEKREATTDKSIDSLKQIEP